MFYSEMQVHTHTQTHTRAMRQTNPQKTSLAVMTSSRTEKQLESENLCVVGQQVVGRDGGREGCWWLVGGTGKCTGQ